MFEKDVVLTQVLLEAASEPTTTDSSRSKLLLTTNLLIYCSNQFPELSAGNVPSQDSQQFSS